MNLSLETAGQGKLKGHCAGAGDSREGSVGLHQQDTVPGQGAGGAGSEGMRLRLGTRQRDETGIRECGWLSLKKKKELMQGKWFIFVYQPTLLLNRNK